MLIIYKNKRKYVNVKYYKDEVWMWSIRRDLLDIKVKFSIVLIFELLFVVFICVIIVLIGIFFFMYIGDKG